MGIFNFTPFPWSILPNVVFDGMIAMMSLNVQTNVMTSSCSAGQLNLVPSSYTQLNFVLVEMENDWMVVSPKILVVTATICHAVSVLSLHPIVTNV